MRITGQLQTSSEYLQKENTIQKCHIIIKLLQLYI